jgi:hypothetical protein
LFPPAHDTDAEEQEPNSRWSAEDLQRTTWFSPLVERVQQELDHLTAERDDHRPALEQEWQQLRERIVGWSQSLAKPNLNPSVRAVVEEEMAQALNRQHELDRRMAESEAVSEQARQVVDAQQVAQRLGRLADVLGGNNPTAGNIELSLHIESVRCFKDGRVIVRTCRLGALAGALDLLASKSMAVPTPVPSDQCTFVATQRRRTRRRVDGGDADARAAAHLAVDINRFAGLGPEWFWEDFFQAPGRGCWSQRHAVEVLRKKRETNWSIAKLAEHFGKSTPTIREALRRAGEQENGASDAA